MERLWIVITRKGTPTRILVNDGSTAVSKVFRVLLEALVLWAGKRVRAVRCVGNEVDASGVLLLRVAFPNFGGPLTLLEWLARATHPTRRDVLRGLHAGAGR